MAERSLTHSFGGEAVIAIVLVIAASIIVLALLTSCARPVQPERKAQIIGHDAAIFCADFGYRRGTDSWHQCIARWSRTGGR